MFFGTTTFKSIGNLDFFMARRRWWFFPFYVVKALCILLLTLFQSITVCFYRQLLYNRDYYFDAEKRKRIKRELAVEKMVKLLLEKVRRLERLVYAVYEDPSYAASDRGKDDLKELHKELK